MARAQRQGLIQLPHRFVGLLVFFIGIGQDDERFKKIRLEPQRRLQQLDGWHVIACFCQSTPQVVASDMRLRMERVRLTQHGNSLAHVCVCIKGNAQIQQRAPVAGRGSHRPFVFANGGLDVACVFQRVAFGNQCIGLLRWRGCSRFRVLAGCGRGLNGRPGGRIGRFGLAFEPVREKSHVFSLPDPVSPDWLTCLSSWGRRRLRAQPTRCFAWGP